MCDRNIFAKVAAVHGQNSKGLVHAPHLFFGCLPASSLQVTLCTVTCISVRASTRRLLCMMQISSVTIRPSCVLTF